MAHRGEARQDGGMRHPALLPASLDPVFWEPDRLGVASAWWGHVPFAHWLVAAMRPGLVVELGTHNGVSYAAFCKAVAALKLQAHCVAVDTWKGDPQAGEYGESVFQELSAWHDARHAGFSRLLRADFDSARRLFGPGSIDLLHIDGLHDEDSVRHDLEILADLEAGTVTFSNVTGYSQPVTVEHRIEDMGLVSDAQINGEIRFTRPLSHAYPAGSYVSSALIAGDLKSRVYLHRLRIRLMRN